MPVELEASLDEQSIEYPALFVEYLLSNDNESSQIASLNANGWCWLVAENRLYLWNHKKNDATYTLNLIPNARPYNAQDIVVYERAKQLLPGVMAVTTSHLSGTVRHWPSIKSTYTDTQLNLNHETLLSLSLLQQEKTFSPTVLLTTTVGSVYELTEDEVKLGKVNSRLLASYTHSNGLGSRLSTMIFGNYDIKSKRALRSLSFPARNQEAGRDIIVLGPAHITIFEEKSTQPAFSISADNLLETLYIDYFKKRTQIPVNSGNYFLLDMVAFRGGLMLLTCATFDHNNYPIFALGYFPTIDSLQMRPCWFSILPIANPTIFQSNEESSFISQLSLLIPGEVNALETTFWDGIIVLHSTFAQAIHPPASLNFYEIPVNKSLFFGKDDQLIGHATNGQFAYAFFSNLGLCTIRLLPKGFPTLFPKNDKIFGDVTGLIKRLLHGNKKFKYHNAELTLFLESFVDFSSKKIKNAERSLSLLTNSQLNDSIHRFLEEILDDERGLITGSFSRTDHQLRFKKLLASQLMFFVKSLDLTETLKRTHSSTMIGSMFSKMQSGYSIICEATERTVGAVAIWEWAQANEDHLELISYTAEHYAQLQRLKQKTPFDVFFRKLTSIQQLPLALVEFVEEKAQEGSFVQNSKEYFTVLLMRICDCLSTLCNAIDNERRTQSPTNESKDIERWTGDRLAPILQKISLIVLKAIDSPIDITSLERKSAIGKVRCLLVFAFSESSKPLEGNEAILILYNIGQFTLARDLAERFKDFKLLIKIAHVCEKEEEKKGLLEEWKQKFKKENFDAYLYKYYRSHGMDEELLKEDGKVADNFIETCEDLRWRRHILNDEFEEAAKNLLVLGERATVYTTKENAYIFAKLSALCADDGKDLVAKADQQLRKFQH
ncbi:unnamed protein product, partial [Mesorhabditis belari]|uniref:Nucleoporin Nup133/Nup155-like N-terminal domain-containing protein n=1 Tax=Mesorhabditis belari TaxID=2138241 RepID=A0AAF3J597_9BILA